MQILQPLAIQNVGLAARDFMHMLSIDQMNFNAASLQDLEQRYPVHTRGLHCHRVDSALLQPVDEGVEILSKCRKRSHRFGIAIGGYGHDGLCSPHIDTSRIGSHHWQNPFYLSVLPLLLFRHRSSPCMKSATSQACMNGKSLKRDHRNRTAIARHQCYGARAWDQTPSRARRSQHQWGYDLRLPLPSPFFTTPVERGPIGKFLTVKALTQDSSGYSFAKEGWRHLKKMI